METTPKLVTFVDDETELDEDIDMSDDEESEYKEPLDTKSVRRESELLKLDNESAWLWEADENADSFDTPIMTRARYVVLNNRFQKVLERLGRHDKLIKLYAEFEGLFNNFRLMYAGQQRLQNKMVELTAQNAVVHKKWVKQVARMKAHEEVTRILRIRLETTTDRANKITEEKNALLLKLEELKTEEMAEETHIDSDEDAESTQSPSLMNQESEELEQKVRELEDRLELQIRDLKFSRDREVKLREKLHQAEATKEDASKQATVAKNNMQTQIVQREKAEATIGELERELAEKNSNFKNLNNEMQAVKKELEICKSSLNRVPGEQRKMQKKLDTEWKENEKLKRDIDARDSRLKIVTEQTESLKTENSQKMSEIHNLKAQVDSVIKQKTNLSKTVTQLEEKNRTEQSKSDGLRNEVAAVQKVYDTVVRERSEIERKLHEITKAKDTMSEDLMKREQIVAQLRIELKTCDEKTRLLSKELDEQKQRSHELQTAVRREELAKERLVKEAIELNKSIAAHRDQIKVLQVRISGYEKSEAQMVQQLEKEASQQKAITEEMRFYQKLSRESEQEMEHVKEKVVALDSFLEQQKSMLRGMRDQNNKLKAQKEQLNQELRSLTNSLKRQELKAGELADRQRLQEKREQELEKMLAGKERDLDDHKLKVRSLTDERDVLSTRLVEKDNALSAGNEKIKLQEYEYKALDKSHKQTLGDAKLLQLQLKNMATERSLMEQRVTKFQETRTTLTEVQREVMAEKLKAKALEEEMQKPINYHRWRVLEGEDADKAQLIAKNITVQKQLLKKTTELDDKVRELQEKEGRIQELNALLMRKGDPGALRDRLSRCLHSLRDTNDRVKVLTTEVHMYQSYCDKYQDEIEGLKAQLRRYKFTEFKKKFQRRQEESEESSD